MEEIGLVDRINLKRITRINSYRKRCFDGHFVKRAKSRHISQTFLPPPIFFFYQVFFHGRQWLSGQLGKRRPISFLSTTSTSSDTFNFHSDTCLQFFVLTHMQKLVSLNIKIMNLFLAHYYWCFLVSNVKMTRVIEAIKSGAYRSKWQKLATSLLPWKWISRSSTETLSLLPLKNKSDFVKQIWLHGIFYGIFRVFLWKILLVWTK